MSTLNIASIEGMIFVVRGQKVMLDENLAALYEVETKSLNRAVRRNIERFPEDFMFQLTADEHEVLRYQIGTLKSGRGAHRKYTPLVFTEQGVAMLSGVLNSERAIRVNVAIMRIFVKIRRILLEESLSHRITELEKGSDKLFRIVFERLDDLEMTAPILPNKRRKIGVKDQ